MGSAISYTLANIFMSEREEESMEELKKMGVVYYGRYVDDIIMVRRTERNWDVIDRFMEEKFKPLVFTHEEQDEEKCLNFLDIMFKIEGEKMTTRVCMRKTDNEKVIPWEDFSPKKWKISSITAYINRAIRISSDWTLIHRELENINRIFSSNGYPKEVINQRIKVLINNYLKGPERNNKDGKRRTDVR